MKNQHEIKVQTLKKRSRNHQKSILNSHQNVLLFFLRFWIKIHSILIPKSVQEPPKIDPEAPPEPPRHHTDTKSLPKTSQEPPETSQRPSKNDFGSLFHPKTSLQTIVFESGNSNFHNNSPKSTFGGRRRGACPIK